MTNDLSTLDEAVLRYMAPMNCLGAPYRAELIRRRKDMLKEYRVTVEIREQGAIGSFQPQTFEVFAHTREEASKMAMDGAHAIKLETRFPLAINEVTK